MIRRVFLGLLLMCAVALPMPVQAGSAQPPPAGSIRFDVHYGSQGFKVGEASHQWTFADGRYELRLTLEARGLAGLFGLQYAQRSVGTLDRSGLRPELFSVDQRGRKTESAHFDWTAARVSIRRDGVERRAGEIGAGTQDLLSLWHQARRIAAGKEPARLTVVTSKSVKKAVLEPLGKETLSLPIGRVEALRVRAYAEEGGLDIDIWLSLQHGLLPVRIRIEDEKGGVLDQRAAQVDLGSPGTAAVTKTK